MSPEEFATQEAEKWKAGLATWGQDGQRIRESETTSKCESIRPAALGSTADDSQIVCRAREQDHSKIPMRSWIESVRPPPAYWRCWESMPIRFARENTS